MNKIKAFQFFNRDISVKEYSDMYKKINLTIRYPANIKREKIFLDLLKKYKPKKIIDAGCGAGMPLIDIKKKGFNIIGYDKSKNMVLEAKENLKKNVDNTNFIKTLLNNNIICGVGTCSEIYLEKNFKSYNINTKKFKNAKYLSKYSFASLQSTKFTK